MPIYEFRCPECGKIVEHLCFRQDPDVICNDCRKMMHKIMSGGQMFNFPTGKSLGKENFN